MLTQEQTQEQEQQINEFYVYKLSKLFDSFNSHFETYFSFFTLNKSFKKFLLSK